MTWHPLILLLALSSASSLELDVINQWSFLDFNFPPDFRATSQFRPEVNVLTGLEITDDRIFLAVPRLYFGVGPSLVVIPRHTPPASSPRLEAYPSWDFHNIVKGQNDSCGGLISVYRMRKDSCNRLWVLDAGVGYSLDDFQRLCPPKLLAIDLNTDQVVKTVVFPRQVLRPSSLLTNLVIDQVGNCDQAYFYMTDTAAPGLVVYDSSKDLAWRLMHPSMFPDPDRSDYNIAGETFTLTDGIVGITLSQRLGVLYYQPLATDRVFSIPLETLRKGPPANNEVLPITLVGTKSSQGVGLAINPADDTIYFSPVTETSIAAWNPVTNNQKLIAYDPEKLQFASELRYRPEDNSLWILSTRFQKFFRRTVNSNEINIRLIRINLSPSLIPTLSNNLFF